MPPYIKQSLKEDFLIFSGQWHDGLPCPIKEGTPSGGLTINIYIWVCGILSFPLILCSYRNALLFCFNGFADTHNTKPLLSLVNRVGLDRILQSEVYVNKADGQLRAVHLILGYTPISRAFQAPRCVIKARDPRLHRISVAYKGFMVPEGVSIPKSTPFTQPLPVATLLTGISSPPPIT